MSEIEYRTWPTDPRYRAGSNGTVVGPRGWTLSPWLTDNGYLQVHAMVNGRRRGVTVHIIVCEAWHGGRPEGMEVAHKNGVKTDCRPANLHWKTRPANHADKVDHGTVQRGETANNRKLTEAEVTAMRAASAGGRSNYRLARDHGISIQHVGRIVRREAWDHVA